MGDNNLIGLINYVVNTKNKNIGTFFPSSTHICIIIIIGVFRSTFQLRRPPKQHTPAASTTS